MPYADPEKAKARRAAYYAANREREQEAARDYARRHGAIWRAETRRIVEEAKGTRCSDCGGEFPVRELEFHHRDSSTKLFNIGDATRLRGSVSHDELRAEIRKCVVLCAPCHRGR